MKRRVAIATGIILIVAFLIYVKIGFNWVNEIMKVPEDNIEYYITDISPFKKKITEQAMMHFPDVDNLEGHGIRVFDENGNHISLSELIYQGEKCKLYVSLVNANPYQDKAVFMLFLDYKIIPFWVDGKVEPQEYYSYLLPPFSMINIPIEFTIPDDEKCSKHRLWFVYLFGMEKKPTPKVPIPYFSVTMKNDLRCEDKKISFNLDKLSISGNTSPATSQITDSCSQITVINEEKKISYQKRVITAPKEKRVNLYLQVYNQDDALYSTVVFFNHEPIVLHESDRYIVWRSGREIMLNHQFSLDIPEEPGDYHLYAISFPLTGELPHELIEMTSEIIIVKVK